MCVSHPLLSNETWKSREETAARETKQRGKKKEALVYFSAMGRDSLCAIVSWAEGDPLIGDKLVVVVHMYTKGFMCHPRVGRGCWASMMRNWQMLRHKPRDRFPSNRP